MKECPFCKSEIKQGAKVCPNCRNRIFDEKQQKSLKKVARILWIIVLVVIIIIIIAALTGKKPEEACKNATEVTLKEIQDKMYENHQNAEATYNNNYYILTGTILHIYSKEVQIKDLNSSYSIFVKFTSDYKDDILKLKVGDKI